MKKLQEIILAKSRLQKYMEQPYCKIRIADGKATAGNKEIFALAIKDYLTMLINTKKMFEFDGSLDINSKRLRWYLKRLFPDVEWILNGSQKPFDIVSISGGVAIELKAERGLSKPTKDGFYTTHPTILSNATLYPDIVKVSDVLNRNSMFKKLNSEAILDVLVVVVARDAKNKSAVDFRIVDGTYWNINYDMYLSCKKIFRVVNQNLDAILGALNQLDENNLFIDSMLAGNDAIDFKLRKLITLKNPLREHFSGKRQNIDV